MSHSPTQCEPELLRQSLDDVLDEQQEERMAEHLNECVECRNMLEALAGGRDDWSNIEAVLRHETSIVPAAGERMASTLMPRDGVLSGAPRRENSQLKAADFAVDFLKPADTPDSIGRLNDIEIRSVIGQGGNGVVLKGFQKELNRLVAVKVMAPQLATSAAARQRFAREAQATAAIVHPNVMPILTVHSDGQLPYLVMPYVDCESLQQRLDREAALPTLDILRIGYQVANGLAAAHAQGLVHRDVKPANILLEKGVDRVMLTDFGLARAVDDATLTRTGLIAGTPQYMSPEQARGDAVDTRSDLFSLGSVMYAMSTGRPPFRAETSYGILRRVTDHQPRPVTELNPDVPKWLQGFVARLQEKSPSDRFASAAMVTEILQECVAHVQQPNSTPLPAVVKAIKSSKLSLRWAMTGAFMVFAVIFAASSAWRADVVNITTSPVDSRDVKVPPAPAAQADAHAHTEHSDDENELEWNDAISQDLQQLDRDVELLLQQLE